jgi:hypothetical protein
VDPRVLALAHRTALRRRRARDAVTAGGALETSLLLLRTRFDERLRLYLEPGEGPLEPELVEQRQPALSSAVAVCDGIRRVKCESHLRQELAQRDRDLDTADPRHVHVQERNLRFPLQPDLDCLGAVDRLEHDERVDGFAGACSHERAEARIVVGEEQLETRPGVGVQPVHN